jgi:4-hydroxy-tetrahydrodipicolinate synthase
MDMSIFRGCLPALMTICDAQDGPDHAARLSTVKVHVDAGKRVVGACGSLGAWPLVSDETP